MPVETTGQTMLPTVNNASAFFAESGGTVFFGGGGLQNATATLCVPYSDDAWEAFCQSQWSLDCASAIAVDPMTFAKVADYGCNIDVERPEGSWFEQDGDTITGACNNATVLASIEGCQGKFSIADTVLPPRTCAGAGPGRPHHRGRRPADLRELHHGVAELVGAGDLSAAAPGDALSASVPSLRCARTDACFS